EIYAYRREGNSEKVELLRKRRDELRTQYEELERTLKELDRDYTRLKKEKREEILAQMGEEPKYVKAMARALSRTIEYDSYYWTLEFPVGRYPQTLTSAWGFGTYLGTYFHTGMSGPPQPIEWFRTGRGLIHSPFSWFSDEYFYGTPLGTIGEKIGGRLGRTLMRVDEGIARATEAADIATGYVVGGMLTVGHNQAREFASKMKPYIAIMMNLPGQSTRFDERLKKILVPEFDADTIESIRRDIEYREKQLQGEYDAARKDYVDAIARGDDNKANEVEANMRRIQEDIDKAQKGIAFIQGVQEELRYGKPLYDENGEVLGRDTSNALRGNVWFWRHDREILMGAKERIWTWLDNEGMLGYVKTETKDENGEVIGIVGVRDKTRGISPRVAEWVPITRFDEASTISKMYNWVLELSPLRVPIMGFLPAWVDVRNWALPRIRYDAWGYRDYDEYSHYQDLKPFVSPTHTIFWHQRMHWYNLFGLLPFEIGTHRDRDIYATGDEWYMRKVPLLGDMRNIGAFHSPKVYGYGGPHLGGPGYASGIGLGYAGENAMVASPISPWQRETHTGFGAPSRMIQWETPETQSIYNYGEKATQRRFSMHPRLAIESDIAGEMFGIDDIIAAYTHQFHVRTRDAGALLAQRSQEFVHMHYGFANPYLFGPAWLLSPPLFIAMKAWNLRHYVGIGSQEIPQTAGVRPHICTNCGKYTHMARCDSCGHVEWR
ncbi:MAG: hypothetical protein QXP42_05765, partial [Candidatus Micrarchaeia archaeon]